MEEEKLVKFKIDKSINREGTDSEKYELREQLFGSKKVLPMWVADMDLPTPDFIIEALKNRLEHPILGYNKTPERVYQSIIDWQAQHGYTITKSEIVFTHNVANGFHLAIQAYTNKHDAILVQPPIYPPFLSAPIFNNRKVIEAPLKLEQNRYEVDFKELEDMIIKNNVKLFLFCNPQNPSGRVWTKSELLKIADICIRNNVLIVSDEIHSDLVYKPNKHIPIASLSTEIADRTITLNSPGKTFNLGGLQIGYALVANTQLKQRYLSVTKSISITELNTMALVALEAGYTQQGQEWKAQLLTHFTSNINKLETFISIYLPKVKIMRPEASYLVWIDFRELVDTQTELNEWLIHKAYLGLNNGESFGGESLSGKGFMRMNLAVSSSVMDQAIAQLKEAIPALDK